MTDIKLVALVLLGTVAISLAQDPPVPYTIPVCLRTSRTIPTGPCKLVSVEPKKETKKCGEIFWTLETYKDCPGEQKCWRQDYKHCDSVPLCSAEQKKGYFLHTNTQCKEVGVGYVYIIYYKRPDNTNPDDPEYIVCEQRRCCCRRHEQEDIKQTGGGGLTWCTEKLRIDSWRFGFCYPGNGR